MISRISFLQNNMLSVLIGCHKNTKAFIFMKKTRDWLIQVCETIRWAWYLTEKWKLGEQDPNRSVTHKKIKGNIFFMYPVSPISLLGKEFCMMKAKFIGIPSTIKYKHWLFTRRCTFGLSKKVHFKAKIDILIFRNSPPPTHTVHRIL